MHRAHEVDLHRPPDGVDIYQVVALNSGANTRVANKNVNCALTAQARSTSAAHAATLVTSLGTEIAFPPKLVISATSLQFLA
jgi:hypothetical protein